ncbi:hypothetical protein EVG20_g10646, partial [Dentipellis fragilis]
VTRADVPQQGAFCASGVCAEADGTQLDAGTDERMMLVSRDEQSVLVVSYKDVKACVESAFRRVGSELARRWQVAKLRRTVKTAHSSSIFGSVIARRFTGRRGGPESDMTHGAGESIFAV